MNSFLLLFLDIFIVGRMMVCSSGVHIYIHTYTHRYIHTTFIWYMVADEPCSIKKGFITAER